MLVPKSYTAKAVLQINPVWQSWFPLYLLLAEFCVNVQDDQSRTSKYQLGWLFD